MNKLLKELSLQAGGSHYPSINTDMQEAFAKLVVSECIKAVQRSERDIARTSYDHSVVEGTIQRCVKSINDHFGFENADYKSKEPHQNVKTR